MPLTAAPVRPPKSKFIFRAVIAVLVLLLLAFLGFDFWFYRAVRAALPQRDGTVRLAGLTAPVIITYDTLAVPNISAANLPDLFFAQGYITAQDRLWQMDMTRRFASGDLAVILGPKYLKYDREQRILGMRQVAARAAANMEPLERAQFEAYAAGVNAYIEQHRKTLPLEFRFLGYSPHVWTVEDSLLVGLSMTEFLNHGLYQDKLEKEKILARLTDFVNQSEPQDRLRFTAALSNGHDLYAFRFAVNDRANTLYYRESDKNILIVSEPLDRDHANWVSVPENHVLVARAGEPARILPLFHRQQEAAE